ncbi:MAG: F0F1 ATP synthase subunit B [Porticoccaceae bacterium]|nr:F0F1 ATP synthase subunit B [Porticoccaceae bacterium]MBT3799342.1 F0F1 ATP synthase subunit B [Porticoccaceae bacterium]MBT4163537.1 F0F1 ATP synthase subunit B [Porticoccaceae bacterium]MBT4211542.1 F0F1 ATP synthase subunit B [Porticoccaceae bacterium]MBT4592420.1 F0F1 ATP synthase subunit B [Porticoccaceae bacterium]
MNINLTLFGQMVTFAIFVWFCMKFVWPVIIGAMEERQQKIADGLDAADRAMRDLEAAKSDATDQMKEAKQEAAGIVDQANKRANQIVDEAKVLAVAEGDRLKAAAEAEIEQEINRAKEELRSKVAGLALAGAEKILEASLDDEANRALVDKLATQL